MVFKIIKNAAIDAAKKAAKKFKPKPKQKVKPKVKKNTGKTKPTTKQKIIAGGALAGSATTLGSLSQVNKNKDAKAGTKSSTKTPAKRPKTSANREKGRSDSVDRAARAADRRKNERAAATRESFRGKTGKRNVIKNKFGDILKTKDGKVVRPSTEAQRKARLKLRREQGK